MVRETADRMDCTKALPNSHPKPSQLLVRLTANLFGDEKWMSYSMKRCALKRRET
jgi:hypothetical protein